MVLPPPPRGVGGNRHHWGGGLDNGGGGGVVRPSVLYATAFGMDMIRLGQGSGHTPGGEGGAMSYREGLARRSEVPRIAARRQACLCGALCDRRAPPPPPGHRPGTPPPHPTSGGCPPQRAAHVRSEVPRERKQSTRKTYKEYTYFECHASHSRGTRKKIDNRSFFF